MEALVSNAGLRAIGQGSGQMAVVRPSGQRELKLKLSARLSLQRGIFLRLSRQVAEQRLGAAALPESMDQS